MQYIQNYKICRIILLTSLFPFSSARSACFIPVIETSILDRNTEWSSLGAFVWDLLLAGILVPPGILNFQGFDMTLEEHCIK